MHEAMAIRVRVLCTDPLVCTGLKTALGDQPDLRWTATDESADVVIADYDQAMRLVSSTGARSNAPGQPPKVLILSSRETEWEIRNALEKGARGYLIQGCEVDEVMVGLRAVHRGMRHLCAPAAQLLAASIACATLTAREFEVLRLVAEGRGNKAIARDLAIAVGTVKSHLKAIFEKLGARSRTEVAALAEKRGLLLAHCGSEHAGPR